MQFHVPQFIDVEDKIFGPLTFKQFVYLAGGAGLCVIIYVFVPTKVVSFPLIAIAAGLALALAFYRVNNKPFSHTLQAAVRYITQSRLYLWKRRPHDKPREELEAELEQVHKAISDMSDPRHNKLRDKSLEVDIGKGEGGTSEPTAVSPNRNPS